MKKPFWTGGESNEDAVQTAMAILIDCEVKFG